MNKKVLVGVGVALLLAGGGGYAMLKSKTAATEKPASSSAPVAPVKAGDKIVADAKVVPVRNATLTFPTGGVVAEVRIKEGDAVKAGQVLARLSAAAQTAAVVQSEAQVQRAVAALAQVKAGPRSQELAVGRAAVEAAQANLARVKQGAQPEEIIAAEAEVSRAEDGLRAAAAAEDAGTAIGQIEAAKAQLAGARARLAKLKRGAGAEEIAAAEAEVRRAQAQYDLTAAGQRAEQVAAAEADVAAARAGLEQAKAALANLELKAPFDGTVAALELKVGEFAAPGAPAVRLADLSAYEIVTDNLTEVKVVRVSQGAPVTITLDAIPGLELTGKVLAVKPFGERKQGDMTYTLTVTPDKLDERLRWNMTASVSIQSK